jgi:hypothetical protein
VAKERTEDSEAGLAQFCKAQKCVNYCGYWNLACTKEYIAILLGREIVASAQELVEYDQILARTTPACPHCTSITQPVYIATLIASATLTAAKLSSLLYISFLASIITSMSLLLILHKSLRLLRRS